jgi:hypothetical protein
MRWLLVGLMAAVLSGCQSVIDVEAIPTARANLNLSLDACVKHLIDREFNSATAYMGCNMAAHKQFADAVKLQKMELFELYAKRSFLLAQTFDQDSSQVKDFSAQWHAITDDYFSNVVASYRIEADQRERTARALQIWGASLQAAGNANRSTYCTPVGDGSYSCR